MHEYSMMQTVLEAVLNAAEPHKAEKVLEISIEVGELTFLKPEELKFVFSILSKGTIAEKARLHIKRIRPRIKCAECGYEGYVKYEGPEHHSLDIPLQLKCTKCGSTKVEITSGRECNVREVKLKLPSGPKTSQAVQKR
jgi:hydrogenase nickel incorporation protein HypA/HybF